jgi:hypothetical protein
MMTLSSCLLMLPKLVFETVVDELPVDRRQ